MALEIDMPLNPHKCACVNVCMCARTHILSICTTVLLSRMCLTNVVQILLETFWLLCLKLVTLWLFLLLIERNDYHIESNFGA